MGWRWHLISVADFQQIDRINTTESDEIDKLAHTVCVIWNKRPDQVNEWSREKFLRYADKVAKVFSKEPPRSWFKLPLETDATKITFGQFVEVMYFLQNGMIDNLHNIAATLMGGEDEHHTRATQMLDTGITRVLHPVKEFLVSWEKMMWSYSGLFELDGQIDMEGDRVKGEDSHPFIEQYGWIFSAAKLAEHERVKLDEVYNIPVIQALNGLAYLKSKGKYEEWLQKK